VYGDFINPILDRQTQEAAQQSAAVDAAQRRSNALEQVAEETNTINLESIEHGHVKTTEAAQRTKTPTTLSR
jgi:hypothetical protein